MKISTGNNFSNDFSVFSPEQIRNPSKPVPLIYRLDKLDPAQIEEHQLEENFRILNWNNHYFSYVPLDTHILKSVFTDEMPNFQYCVKLIEGYNKDIDNCRKNALEIKEGPWKNKFYGILQNLLREIIFTKDNRLLQRQFADRVCLWAKEQMSSRVDVSNFRGFQSTQMNSTISTNPSTSRLRAVTHSIDGGNSFQKQNVLSNTNENHKRQNSEIKITNLLDEINFSIPSNQINNTLKDYEQGNRTKHSDIDPPQDRLLRFKKKQLQFEDPTKVLQKALDKLPHLESKTTYPKPIGYIPQKPEEINLQQQQQLGEQQQEGFVVGPEDKGDILQQLIENDQDEEDIVPEIDEKEKNKMIPDKKAFSNDEIYKQQVVPEQNKQPEIKSIFRDYQPSKDAHELKMEYKWLQSRQNDVKKKREDEEIVKIMNDFGQARNKIIKDINNKLERQLYGSKFTECEYRPRNYTMRDMNDIDNKIKNGKLQEEDTKITLESQNDFIKQSELRQKRKQKSNSMHISVSNKNLFAAQKSEQLPKQIDYTNHLPSLVRQNTAENQFSTHNLEYKISKQKISQARKLYGNLINIPKHDEDVQKPQTISSLSVYSKNLNSYLRPFSAIFDKLNPDEIKNEQLEEIHEIKNRLAKYKINIPIKKLMDSISIPQPVYSDKVELPQPGLGLMENPYFEVAKKKKKKK